MKIALSALLFAFVSCVAVGPAYAHVKAGTPKHPDAKASYPYLMKIRTYNGAMGFGFDYYLAADSLTVVARNDFGRKPKEVLRSVFQAADKARWSRILAAFPLERLAMTYARADVDDGLQMWFDFRIPGKPKKQIYVGNMGQNDLDGLCLELDKNLPEPLRLPRLRDPFLR